MPVILLPHFGGLKGLHLNSFATCTNSAKVEQKDMQKGIDASFSCRYDGIES
jgi:hypothetical protein